MADRFSELRQMGADVGNAIQSPSAARLRGEQFKYQIKNQEEAKARLRTTDAFTAEERARKKSEWAKKDKQDAAKDRFSQLVQEGKGNTNEGKAAAIEAGMSPDAMLRMMNPKTAKPKSPGFFETQFNAAELYLNNSMGIVNDSAKAVSDKLAAGEDASAEMEQFSAQQDAIKQTIHGYLARFQNETSSNYAVMLSQSADKVLSQMDQRTLDFTTEMMKKTVDKMGGNVKKYSDILDSNNNKYSDVADTNDIPTTADIYKVSLSAKIKRDLPDDARKALFSIKDPNELVKIIESDKSNESQKLIATMILRKAVAAKLAKVKEVSSKKFYPDEPGATPTPVAKAKARLNDPAPELSSVPQRPAASPTPAPTPPEYSPAANVTNRLGKRPLPPQGR